MQIRHSTISPILAPLSHTRTYGISFTTDNASHHDTWHMVIVKEVKRFSVVDISSVWRHMHVRNCHRWLLIEITLDLFSCRACYMWWNIAINGTGTLLDELVWAPVIPKMLVTTCYLTVNDVLSDSWYVSQRKKLAVFISRLNLVI